jgi:hypothetical protein
VLRALSGLLHLNPREDWQSQTEDLTDLLWKGMCPRLTSECRVPPDRGGRRT